MITATISDGPAFNIRSKTSCQNQTTMNTEPPNTQLNKETVTSDLTTVKTTEDVTPKPLTEDRHRTLLQMQKMDSFCKCISKWLSNSKAAKHGANLFTHINTIQMHYGCKSEIYGTHHTKSLEVDILVEAHNKLRLQGLPHTYCLIKQQYFWKGINKDIQTYIANCSLFCREKAKVQSYPLQMTEIPDRPFDKIAIDLVTECKTSTSGNKHILTIIDHLTG